MPIISVKIMKKNRWNGNTKRKQKKNKQRQKGASGTEAIVKGES